MRIVITGGTGFIGGRLLPTLVADGHEVVALTRGQPRQAGGVRYACWTPEELGPWQAEFDGADAVIHLAGKGIFDDRWSAAVRRELVDSRVIPTRLIVHAIGQAERPPKVLISGSAVGYYGDVTHRVDEDAPPGDDFLARLCVEWEHEALRAGEYGGVRAVCLRTGIVLGQGGALEQMARPFRLFVGGPIGDGRQFVPWIHIDDAVGLIRFALTRETLRGPVNLTAPNPLTMNDFSKLIGAALGRPAALRVPAFALKLAAGGASEVLLGGQNAWPARALAAGYTFRFDDARAALEDILQRGGG